MWHGTSVSFIALFAKSIIAGLLTVLTPFIYAILPVTAGYLSRGKSAPEAQRNLLTYAASLIIMFTTLGVLIGLVIHFAHLEHLSSNWIFSLFLARLFFGLGLSFLGAFELKLPASWAESVASKARSGSKTGIFYMALTLPVISFSSMAPMVVLALLLAGKAGVMGPVVGLFGYSIGLSLPFVFPDMLKPFVASKVLLNQVKVLLGFFAVVMGIKFFSNADIELGWNLFDRDLFIIVLMLLGTMVGLYMLGLIKLPKDHVPSQNIYGVNYIAIYRLFIAIASFTFVVYLLPGIWGAPLHGINKLLPPQTEVLVR